jgi:hypothetical protein
MITPFDDARVRYLAALGLLGAAACAKKTIDNEQPIVIANVDAGQPVIVATTTPTPTPTPTPSATPDEAALCVEGPRLPRCDSGGAFCVDRKSPKGENPWDGCEASLVLPDRSLPGGNEKTLPTGGLSQCDTFRSAKAGKDQCCYRYRYGFRPCPGGRPLRDEEGAPRLANAVMRADWISDRPA